MNVDGWWGQKYEKTIAICQTSKGMNVGGWWMMDIFSLVVRFLNYINDIIFHPLQTT